jgi:hypothetical protein
MAEESSKAPMYTPKVSVGVKDGEEVKSIQIPVPSGQEWLYAALEYQYKELKTIKRIMVFFLILTIIVIIFAACSAITRG